MKFPLAALALLLPACSAQPHVGPAWLADAHIMVPGVGTTNTDCRAGICQHNENVDVIAWNGAIYLVHRTAMSQILGPNCSWFVYRSTDHGKSFQRVAHLVGPTDRDLRDPHFYSVGSELFIYGGARLPVVAATDNGIDAKPTGFKSSDGVTWQSLGTIGPEMWTFWRPKLHDGTWYNAAYHDGETDDALFSSTDGVTWTLGPDIYNMPDDHEDECELTFMPSGALLALVRLDGTPTELLGETGRLRTKVCWSTPPYSSFSCPQELMGERLDGPLSLFWNHRLFVIARRHIDNDTAMPKKRTSLFEITGDFANAGTIGIKLWGDLPSAGDTAYAGAAAIDDHRMVVAWYSGDLQRDEEWFVGTISETNIWQAVIDFSLLK